MRRLFVFLLPLLLHAACQTARGGIIVSTESFGGSTYHLFTADAVNTPQTWAEAEAFSVSLGGHLVAINSDAENAFLFDRFGDPDPGNFGIWIGLSDATSEGHFIWSNGDPVTYTNWWPGQPDNLGGQDFAYLIDPDSPVFTGATGQWDDGSAPQVYGIAEITAVPESSSIALFLTAASGILLRRRRPRSGIAG